MLAFPRQTPLSSFFRDVTLRVARVLDLRFGLALGEAVGACNRLAGIVLAGTVDRIIVGPIGRRRILRKRRTGQKRSSRQQQKKFLVHVVLL